MYLGITCFYHENEENGCFSNWYKAEFTYARRRFSSVEQYMMYHKALMFREYDLANKNIVNSYVFLNNRFVKMAYCRDLMKIIDSKSLGLGIKV